MGSINVVFSLHDCIGHWCSSQIATLARIISALAQEAAVTWKPYWKPPPLSSTDPFVVARGCIHQASNKVRLQTHLRFNLTSAMTLQWVRVDGSWVSGFLNSFQGMCYFSCWFTVLTLTTPKDDWRLQICSESKTEHLGTFWGLTWRDTNSGETMRQKWILFYVHCLCSTVQGTNGVFCF